MRDRVDTGYVEIEEAQIGFMPVHGRREEIRAVDRVDDVAFGDQQRSERGGALRVVIRDQDAEARGRRVPLEHRDQGRA